MASVYMSLGNDADGATRELRSASARGARITWTINATAVPGDLCAFYIVAPVSGFVATGIVDSVSEKVTNPASGQFGLYRAKIVDVKILPRTVPIAEVRQAVPRWTFLRTPRHGARVPEQWQSAFLKVLGAPPPPGAHLSYAALEGLKTETRVITSSRSRSLRDSKLAKAGGVCECCKMNYGALLKGEGAKVLLVHHRRQLKAMKSPAVVKESDLAVVCANCHALIHADPKKARKVEDLARLLKGARTRRRA